MNTSTRILLSLALTMLIITSCAPPGTAVNPDPVPGVSIINITPGDSALTVSLQAPQGTVLQVFAHKEKDYSDEGVKQQETASGSPQNITFSGLTNGISYYIRVQSESEKNEAQWIEPEDKSPQTPEPHRYILTVTPPSQGSITITVEGEVKTSPVALAMGEKAQLEYTPPADTHYFISWTEDNSDDVNPLMVTMDKHKTIAVNLEETKEYIQGDITYTLYKDTAVISGYHEESPVTSLILEGSVTRKGITYPLTAIKEWVFYKARSIQEVSIPASVLLIEDKAFLGVRSLRKVEFLGDETIIEGEFPFEGTELMKKYHRPLSAALHEGAAVRSGIYSAVNNYRVDPFEYSLYQVRGEYYASMNDYHGEITEGEITEAIPQFLTYEERDYPVTSIGERVFDGNPITKITIPESTIYIEEYAFHGSNLTDITIPRSTRFIAKAAFMNTHLLMVKFQGDNTLLGPKVFKYSPLDSMNIFVEDSQLPAGDYLVQLHTPDGINSDMEFILYEIEGKFHAALKQFDSASARTDIAIPQQVSKDAKDYTVTKIRYKAFFNNDTIVNVTIPHSVVTIEFDAFSWCDNFISVTIPDSVTFIGDSSFSLNPLLREVIFGEDSQLASVGRYAFAENLSLSVITIPASVTSLGGRVFAGGRSLNKAVFKGSSAELGTKVFLDTPLEANPHLNTGSPPAAGVYEGTTFTPAGS